MQKNTHKTASPDPEEEVFAADITKRTRPSPHKKKTDSRGNQAWKDLKTGINLVARDVKQTLRRVFSDILP